MSSGPYGVSNVKFAPAFSVRASSRKGRSLGAPRSVAPSSWSAAASRSRLAGDRSYARSRSKLGYDDPSAMPANPPTTTKSTPFPTSACSIGFGLNSTRPGNVLLDEIGKRDAVLEPLVHRALEIRLEQRDVVAEVDLCRAELELLAEQVEQLRECRHGRRHDVALDPRDRGLARPGPGGELLLGHVMAPSRVPEKLTRCHRSQ